MDNQSKKDSINALAVVVEGKILDGQQQDATSFFDKRELDLLDQAKKNGVMPIAPSRASQMFEIFYEGYGCAEIARLNPPFREGDILFIREKYRWDETKATNYFKLQNQVIDRVAKIKLELIDLIGLQVAVFNKEHKIQALKYLQSGKDEDKPESMISGPTSLKGMIEALQKLTGEDRVMTQKIKSESTVKIESNQPVTLVNPELQSKMLKKLALSEGGNGNSNES